jgi:ketosteroid isomerase-like protein
MGQKSLGSTGLHAAHSCSESPSPVQ